MRSPRRPSAPPIAASLAMAILVAGTLALAGCAAPQSRADQNTDAACRARAEQAYDIQNRGAIYLPAPSGNTPFSSNYEVGDTSAGLGALHAHDEMVNDCVRNTGTQPLKQQP